MNMQQWKDGNLEETETDYKVSGKNILYKSEKPYLTKGVGLLCDKLSPKSVLEFGFGLGWTATEFQKQGVQRHVILEANKEIYQNALEWKKQFTTDIEIINIFSWDFETSEKFDLVYDDREPFNDMENNHFKQMAKILPPDQWYAMNVGIMNKKTIGYDTVNYCVVHEAPNDFSISFESDGILYRQFLRKGFYNGNI